MYERLMGSTVVDTVDFISRYTLPLALRSSTPTASECVESPGASGLKLLSVCKLQLTIQSRLPHYITSNFARSVQFLMRSDVASDHANDRKM